MLLANRVYLSVQFSLRMFMWFSCLLRRGDAGMHVFVMLVVTTPIKY